MKSFPEPTSTPPDVEVFHRIAEIPQEPLMRGLGTGAIAAPMAISFREEKLALQSSKPTVSVSTCATPSPIVTRNCK